MNEPLIIIGNGPSLNTIDFSLLVNKHTFGLKYAYKLYKTMKWYPKYWGWFDKCQMLNDTQFKIDLQDMLCDKDCTIERFILFNEVNFNKDLKCTDRVIFIDQHFAGCPSPIVATEIGVAFGYKKIIYIGIDSSYNINEKDNMFWNTLNPIVDTLCIEKVYNDSSYLKDMTKTNNINEFYAFINKNQNEHFEHIKDKYKHIDFVNCGGSLSKLDIFRRGELKNEL